MHPQHTINSLIALLLAGTLLAACGDPGTTTTDPTLRAEWPQRAAQLFEAACASCHGPLGEGGLAGVTLNHMAATDRQLIIDAIRHGVGAMPASSGGMSDEQIKALAEYVAGLR